MDDQRFKEAIREISFQFTTKLNQLNLLLLVPILILYATKLFQYPIVVVIGVIYLAISVFFVFSKIPISLHLRKLLTTNEMEKNERRLEALNTFFHKNNLFNKLFQKRHHKILESLNEANVAFKRLMKQYRK